MSSAAHQHKPQPHIDTADAPHAAAGRTAQTKGVLNLRLSFNVLLDADSCQLTPTTTQAEFRPDESCTPNSAFASIHASAPVRFAFRKGLGVWQLIYDYNESPVRHERGASLAGWLLNHPPEHPLHGLDLTAKIPEIYRQQLGLPALVDPATGKAVTLESGARIQERSLALDEEQAMRGLYKKKRELEGILDSDDATEPEKAEALQELEQITEFLCQQGRQSRDSARRAAHAVRSAIARFHAHLRSAVGEDGEPHPVLRPFADHIEKHILIPSARYSGHGGPYARTGLAGCFTYERPEGVWWSR